MGKGCQHLHLEIGEAIHMQEILLRLQEAGYWQTGLSGWEDSSVAQEAPGSRARWRPFLVSTMI